jgi:hypothetical protein
MVFLKTINCLTLAEAEVRHAYLLNTGAYLPGRFLMFAMKIPAEKLR